MRLPTSRIVIASFVGVLLPVFLMACKAESNVSLVGNLLRQPFAAADFTLTDQNGAPFRMGAMKGKVVLLSFIYTHCTDICPFIALKVKDAYQLLGKDAANVVLVAVTTDPKRDVPQVTAAYSRQLGLENVWHFVGGEPAAVQAVWASYGIGVTTDAATGAVAPKEEKTSSTSSGGSTSTAPAEESPPPTQGLSEADLNLAGTIINTFGGGYEVGHSAPFWIVDKEGLIRVGMDADATPADLVTNIRALLKLR
jgi:cytochrome oxidase Cu insertion factor (SCO1/SenC/PrrC family)